MTEKISIVNASDYQIFPGDSGGSMMVEDEFQPDGEEEAPSDDPLAAQIKTEVDCEGKDADPLVEKVIHIDTRYDPHSLCTQCSDGLVPGLSPPSRKSLDCQPRPF